MTKNATVYVGNAPYDTTEDELRTLFAPRKINRVTIVMDKETQRPRGFSFVEFANPADAESAVAEHNGAQFGGRTLKISIAREREGRSDDRRERRR